MRMQTMVLWRILRLALPLVAILIVSNTADAAATLKWRKSLGPDVLGAGIALSSAGDRLAVLPQHDPETQRANDTLMVLSRTGEVVWQYRAPSGERFGGVAISPDGQRVFCDYWTKPRLVAPLEWPDGQKRDPDDPNMPLDKVAYAGGIYCFDPAGQVLWKTRIEGTEVGPPISSPLGNVRQATSTHLLVVKPGEECERGVTVLDSSGRSVFQRDFTQEDGAHGAALLPNGFAIGIGWGKDTLILDLKTGTTGEVKGLALRDGMTATAPDATHLLLAAGPDYFETTTLALAGRDGDLKWTYAVPKSWSASIVPSTGGVPGQPVPVTESPLLGAGPEGTSVVLVRGPRRVLFRFPPNSYSPKEIELPAVEDGMEQTFLSHDGTAVAVIRTPRTDDAVSGRKLQIGLFAESAALLGELDLGEWRNAWRRPLSAEFSNPTKHLAISAGPDLYFIEVTR